MDRKLVLSLSKSRIPKLSQLKYLSRYLSRAEAWIFYVSVVLFIISAFFLAGRFYYTHLEVMPKRSGIYAEGLIGQPKYINPLYAGASDADSDISRLVFSSLFRRNKDGVLVKDLVESFEISEDKKTYTIKIRQDAKWHSGGALTSNDIYFTFNAIKDVAYKSSLRSGFGGVSMEVSDDYSFKFVLNSPYAAFLELLTFGILPADHWSLIPPESAAQAGINLKPVGSGPYRYKQHVKEEKLGTIKEYELIVNEEYYGQIPYVGLNFKFFTDFESAISALNNNEIDGISYIPADLKDDIAKPRAISLHKLYLPQVNAVFINKAKNAALGDKALRQALVYGLDVNSLINNILKGEAYAVSGPILPGNFAYYAGTKKYDFSQAEAVKLLEGIDWKIFDISSEAIEKAKSDVESENENTRTQAQKILRMDVGKWRKKGDDFLLLRLMTVERPENQAVAEELRKYWEKIGVKIELEIIPASQIQSKTIKPRDFDLLLYGQVLGADPDPYPFWHSSQAGEQGLNISDFSDKEADRLLEDARLADDAVLRQEKYKRFQELIAEEVPAIFLYSPLYTYAQNLRLKGFFGQNIYVPSDRFNNVGEWYLETEKRLKR